MKRWLLSIYLGVALMQSVHVFLRDFVKACQPEWMEVVGIFNARGGITTTAIATYGDVQP